MRKYLQNRRLLWFGHLERAEESSLPRLGTLSLPRFLGDQTIAIFYSVNIPSWYSVSAYSQVPQQKCSPGLKSHIHMAVLASSHDLFNQSSLFVMQWKILRWQAEYDLSFAPKGKPLLVDKGNGSLNVLHSFLFLLKHCQLDRLYILLFYQDKKLLLNFKRLTF